MNLKRTVALLMPVLLLGGMLAAGCEKTEPTSAVNPEEAKKMPGASTPAQAPAAINQSQIRADKEGK